MSKDASQRTDEWDRLDADALSYHMAQWDTPKRSTVAFEVFMREQLRQSKRVVDLGSGAGAVTAYLARCHPAVAFAGLDYSSSLVSLGLKIAADKQIGNLSFEQADWYNLGTIGGCDGVVSSQTISWLPDYGEPLRQIFRSINPEWIALSSLFYEGDITCKIEVEEHAKNRKCFYNVYSLPAISRLCEEEGYSLVKALPFEIDIDIERPGNLDIMGTYTIRVVNHDYPDKIERLQISGPLLMNWRMVLIQRHAKGKLP